MKTSVPDLLLTAALLAPVLTVADTHYVSVNSTNPVAPYTNWATAANVIQDAVEVASGGDTVLVTNGVYDTGGKALSDTTTNRVAVTQPMFLMSVNGPSFTTILGYQVPETTNGASAVRCVYLTNNAFLSGFTLTRGAAGVAALPITAGVGGGILCESTNAYVSNCVITGNAARNAGGGAFWGTLTDCTITSNTCSTVGVAGGCYGGVLSNCTVSGNVAGSGGGCYVGQAVDCSITHNRATSYAGGGAGFMNLSACTIASNSSVQLGGGVHESVLSGCILLNNHAEDGGGGAAGGSLTGCVLDGNTTFGGGSINEEPKGGGAYDCSLDNSLLVRNYAERGGGTAHGQLDNCILMNNSAKFSGGASYYGYLRNCTLTDNYAVWGGGSHLSHLYNSILIFNRRSSSGSDENHLNSTLYQCCTTPLPSNGIGNITNAPLFVDTNGWADLRLQSNSPCINAGNNTYVTATNDLDGNPRIVGGTVDMGAYEQQSPMLLAYYSWLEGYGLPTDGSVDDLDDDGDKATTWQEWKMWTNPTNAWSVLKMLSLTLTTNGTVVRWRSLYGQNYTLERAEVSASSFSVIDSNITGWGGVGSTAFTDTTATNSDAFLYRVSVPE